MNDPIAIYFDGEKQGGMICIPLAIAAFAFAFWVWRGNVTFRAMAIPVAIFGLIQADEPIAYLEAAARLLRPGGGLDLSTPPVAAPPSDGAPPSLRTRARLGHRSFDERRQRGAGRAGARRHAQSDRGSSLRNEEATEDAG